MSDTPAAQWRIDGEADPHGEQFNCKRKDLACGHLTDDQMANAVFMQPHIGNLQAAKDRIRWLSRKSEKLEQSNKELLEALTTISNMCVGDQALGYRLDSQSIGELIYKVTGKTNPELNDITNAEREG